MKPKAVLAYCREKGIKAFDLRFVDVLGAWRHITFPVSALTEACFDEGFGHDIVLDPTIDSTPSHAILVPQGVAHYLDPFPHQPTLVLLASVQDALMREDSPLDSRHVAVQAMQYLESSTIGDGLAVRARCQFRIDRDTPSDSRAELIRNTHLACGPTDLDFKMRCEVADIASEAGLHIERHFSGPESSSEMVLKPSSLVECCDDILMLRYIIGQNAWKKHELVSSANLGIPSQWSISRQGESILVGSSYRGLSETGLHAIGGILKHADALCAMAFANDPNACRSPWFKLCSANVAESICRAIISSNNPRDRAIEFRGAPANCNPYLVYSAVLMAMIDGIQNKMSPGSALEKKIETAEDRIKVSIGHIAEGDRTTGRRQLMESLVSDCDFLCRGEVFSSDLIDSLCRQLTSKRGQEPNWQNG